MFYKLQPRKGGSSVLHPMFVLGPQETCIKIWSKFLHEFRFFFGTYANIHAILFIRLDYLRPAYNLLYTFFRGLDEQRTDM